MKKLKQAYEWVVNISGQNQPYILTENQYQLYKDTWKEGKIFFTDFELNPSFITSAQRRPAQWIRIVFPCDKCSGNGVIYAEKVGNDGEFPTCKNCEGTGIDYKNQKGSQQSSIE